jgi:hypothetical protein
MNVNFTDKLSSDLNLLPILISGSDSSHLNGREYLIIIQNDVEKDLYEIRYEAHCSPFKQAIIVDEILAVGHEEHFYLFNLTTNTNMLRLKMEWYFGHLYYHNDFFYIADASGLYCIDKKASIHWQNNNLAIDGVIINEFAESKILGSGEWDPPGGWRDFVLDKQTGIATE